MIPLRYRLREGVRLEPGAGGAARVVSGSPLNVVSVNAAAAHLLELTRDGTSVSDIAAELGTSAERVFALCEHLRGRGMLEVGRAASSPEFVPSVTVIVPTRDRADDLADCLDAISRLEYPRDRLGLIVVDDGSTDPVAIAEVAALHGARLLVNERNRGPSYSRNRAAREAAGELLAFIDSDCVAGPGWLVELTQYFLWDHVGAVGGRTIGYYGDSSLDRYEEVASPLDMGKHLRLETRGAGSFYVPTCNLLVRRSLYQDLGGLREDLLVGEDVDFCWRLRAHGEYLVYAPEGLVRHKHRNRLGAMLRRRAAYGTSEATLQGLHPDKRKRFPAAPAPLATTALLSAALVGRSSWLLPASLAPAIWDGRRRARRLRRNGVDLPTRDVYSSVLRGHLSMLYFVYFHLVRYYLAPLAAIGVLVPGFRRLATVAALYSSAIDYAARRPRLSYPVYFGYYLAEHAAYQVGVIKGCVGARSFRSYLPALQAGNRLPSKGNEGQVKM